ncbi:methionine biosynthesis protein MetW [Auraticoccus monumenti]|uniref:Methionine biosynthesis protein MetW n=1 Tax=Auraticoccus monumenti TaxID=675864 RepID=A0A1G7BKS3_9ACTN|nr:methionine biosynthesis protein MetW [Auraticoccus monumenti]SDE27629.1 methionine biosynthesis protein MetW [Auraticoccus monumenti]
MSGRLPAGAGARRRRPTRHLDLRDDLAVVADLIADGSRVLDLGCADGQLVRHLERRHGCTGTGVEIDPEAVVEAIGAGVSVIELDIDAQLHEFGDDSYDVVVLSKVLQATRRPAEVLAQMSRIAPRCIVSVPNFGLWSHRWRLLRGRMPMSPQMPYDWHDTPNIHNATLVDLEEFLAEQGFTVEQRILFDAAGRVASWPDPLANLLSGAAVYLLARGGDATP